MLFAFELDRRARTAGTRVSSMAAHPGYAATNLSLLRKMSLNLLLKASPPGMSLKRMRLRAARNLDHLTEIIAPLLENDPNFLNA